MTDAPVLPQRALNRAMLARQRLLERADLPLPDLLAAIGGLQAQYAPAMYVGLWSRLRDFRREDLDRALGDRTVVQGTLLRSTIHLVAAPDYWPWALAVRAARRRWFERTPSSRALLADLPAAVERLRERLADGSVSRKEVEQIVGRPLVAAMHLWLDLVRVPPSGTWARRRADLYAAAEDWVGPPPALPVDPVEHVVRQYLSAFGPARPRDAASWAGLPVAAVTAVTRRLGLCRFRDEAGGELLDLPDAPRPDPRTPVPVRFLPVWDAMLLVHARRTGVLPEAYRPLVFTTKNPQSVSTFLVDGAVAGTWRYADGRVDLDPYVPLDPAVRREAEAESEALAALHA